MASTSRTLVLLGLLVASFCVSANAGRDLAETSKLDLSVALRPGLVAGLNVGVELELNIDLDLTAVISALEVAVKDAAGETVDLGAVTGVLNKLKAPVTIFVSAEKLLTIILTINGEKKTINIPLADVVTAVSAPLGVVNVVLGIVQTVVNQQLLTTVIGTAGQIVQLTQALP